LITAPFIFDHLVSREALFTLRNRGLDLNVSCLANPKDERALVFHTPGDIGNYEVRLRSHRLGLWMEIDIRLERMISSMDAKHSFNHDLSINRRRKLPDHPRRAKANERIATRFSLRVTETTPRCIGRQRRTFQPFCDLGEAFEEITRIHLSVSGDKNHSDAVARHRGDIDLTCASPINLNVFARSDLIMASESETLAKRPFCIDPAHLRTWDEVPSAPMSQRY
jgi:hypothetical protein